MEPIFNPLVSIVIPVYNGSNFVKESIDSALAQTYKNIEIIVVNDGSKDNTEEIVKSYGNKLRYFKKENGGVATALNMGIQKMKGDYFSWLSHDDLYYPDKIQKQIEVLRKIKKNDRKNTILLSNYSLIDEESNLIAAEHFEKSHLIDDLQYSLYPLLSGIVNGLTLLIPKKCFEETGYFDPSLRATQDYDLWFKMFPKYKTIYMTDLLAKTRLHIFQTTNKPSTFLENDSLWINMIKNMSYEQKISVGKSIIGFYKKVYKVVQDAKFVGAESYLLEKINEFQFRDTSKIKVSVIIPFFNRIEWTLQSIKSVLNQTHQNLEIILVNDGSTDDIKSVERIAKKENRIKLVKNKRLKGVSGARNTGIDFASGEYIAFLDSDDLFLPDKVERQLNYMVKNGFSFSHTSYQLFSNDKKDSRVIYSGEKDLVYPSIISNCTIATPTVMLHSDLFKDKSNRFLENYSIGEDTCLWIKISRSTPCVGIKGILTKVRKHGLNAVYDDKKQIIGVKNILNYVINNFFNVNIIDQINILNNMLIEKNVRDEGDKIKRHFDFSNLQVSDNDLIGNKFNGHDLHFYLRENNIDSYQLVWNKESNDNCTFQIAADKDNRLQIYSFVETIQKKYQLNSLANPLVYDILYNKFFLESDVIHFHLIHNNIFDIQLLPIMSRLKPTVWTLHDPWSLGGHCIHPYDCEKWKKQCGDCPYLDAYFSFNRDNSALNFEIKKQALKNSRLDIIVASNWMLKKIKQSPMFEGKEIHLIPFGVNQEIYRPMNKDRVREELGIPKGVFVITFRCAYSQFKGMEYIEYVLKNINTTKKSIYVLTVAQKFEIKIKNIVCINFGWVSDENLLSKIYNASDLFLAPSEADSFGMMTVEAMCCGVLPIVLNGTALPDTINAPDCGVSVNADKQEYFKVVCYYMNHDDDRIERSKKCLKYAEVNYNKDQYVKKIISVYKDAIKNHSIEEEDKTLLNQLKKYMMIDPRKYSIKTNSAIVDINNCSVFNNSIFRKYIPEKYRKKIKDLLLIIFYTVDKIVPKKIRRRVKPKLIKYKFVRDYLIVY